MWYKISKCVPLVLVSWQVLPIFITCLRLVMSTQMSSMSLEPVFPTPLTNILNETEAASLREQTNNVSNSVTNTSFNDLYNDSDTQRMQLRYRERKRQERLLLIQRDILQMLGFSKEPNMTSRLSQEERQRMLQIYDRRRSHELGSNYTDAESTHASDTEGDQVF